MFADGSKPSHGRPERPSLQVYLIALVLLVLIPTLGVVTLTLLRASQSYREASTNQLLETAHVSRNRWTASCRPDRVCSPVMFRR